MEHSVKTGGVGFQKILKGETIIIFCLHAISKTFQEENETSLFRINVTTCNSFCVVMFVEDNLLEYLWKSYGYLAMAAYNKHKQSALLFFVHAISCAADKLRQS